DLTQRDASLLVTDVPHDRPPPRFDRSRVPTERGDLFLHEERSPRYSIAGHCTLTMSPRMAVIPDAIQKIQSCLAGVLTAAESAMCLPQIVACLTGRRIL